MSKLVYALGLPNGFSLSRREITALSKYKFAKLRGTYHIYVELGDLPQGEAQLLPLDDAMDDVSEAANVYAYIGCGKPIYPDIACPVEYTPPKADFYILSPAVERVSAHKFCKTKCGDDCISAPAPITKVGAKSKAKPKVIVGSKKAAVAKPKTKVITVSIPNSHPMFLELQSAGAAQPTAAQPAAAAAANISDDEDPDAWEVDDGDTSE